MSEAMQLSRSAEIAAVARFIGEAARVAGLPDSSWLLMNGCWEKGPTENGQTQDAWDTLKARIDPHDRFPEKDPAAILERGHGQLRYSVRELVAATEADFALLKDAEFFEEVFYDEQGDTYCPIVWRKAHLGGGCAIALNLKETELEELDAIRHPGVPFNEIPEKVREKLAGLVEETNQHRRSEDFLLRCLKSFGFRTQRSEQLFRYCRKDYRGRHQFAVDHTLEIVGLAANGCEMVRALDAVLNQWSGEVDAGLHHLEDAHALKPPSGCIDATAAQRLCEDFARAGNDIGRYEALQRRRNRQAVLEAAPSWLVEGYIPRGSLVMLAGRGGVGKSTLAHELIVAVGTKPSEGEEPPRWLGREIVQNEEGRCYLITLEEGERRVLEREERLDPDMRAIDSTEVVPLRSRDELLPFLAKLEANPFAESGKKPPRLVVIDSAAKFIAGSELTNDAWDALLDPLEQFAKRTGATVLVLHHLRQEGARPIADLRDVHRAIRGHTSAVDRPRLVLGMYRNRRDQTIIGVVKENVGLGHLEYVEDVFARDPKTYRHMPIASAGASASRRRGKAASATSAPTVEDRALAAIVQLADEGEPVTKSGPKGLYQRKLPELEGVSKQKVESAISALVAQGRVVRDDDGRLRLPATAGDEAPVAVAAE